jgi:hypothetical protein
MRLIVGRRSRPVQMGTPDAYEEKHPQENVPDAEEHPPSWFRFFRWPDGTTTWAIIFTLIAIAAQTEQTKKAAVAGQTAVSGESACQAGREVAGSYSWDARVHRGHCGSVSEGNTPGKR